MSAHAVELALGTVQFGLPTASPDAANGSEREIKDILALAWRAGVRTLDTASAYGDIEERLGGLSARSGVQGHLEDSGAALHRCHRGSGRA